MSGEAMTPDRIKQLADIAESMARADAMAVFNHANERSLLRESLAHWEVAELFRYCMRLAIHDALRVTDFQAFHDLWQPLVGEAAECWLPSIYLAAVASPAFAPDVRRALAETALRHL